MRQFNLSARGEGKANPGGADRDPTAKLLVGLMSEGGGEKGLWGLVKGLSGRLCSSLKADTRICNQKKQWIPELSHAEQNGSSARINTQPINCIVLGWEMAAGKHLCLSLPSFSFGSRSSLSPLPSRASTRNSHEPLMAMAKQISNCATSGTIRKLMARFH